MTGPLHGLTVIEMEGLGPCPLAGQLLADLGAKVTVITRTSKSHDPTDVNHRGKRAIGINLKSAQGAALAMQLIETADVLLEGFRPGVMERLGLSPELCCERNERLVVGRITGWGQTGPLSQSAGHDINYLAITGALAAIGKRHSAPIPPLNLVGDYAGGSMFLVFGVLAALFERSSSGRGQIIDAAMVDGVPAMMGLIHQLFAQQQWSVQRESNYFDGGAPFYRCYETKDGLYMAVGAIEAPFYKLLVGILGLPELSSVDHQDKSVWPEHAQKLAQRFLEQPQAYWVKQFENTDACVTPVLTFDTMESFPHNAERGTVRRVEGVLQAAAAPRFSRTPAADATSSLANDSGRAATLSTLNIDATQEHLLREAGVLT